MALQQVEVVVDGGDQPGAPRHKQQGAEAAGGQPVGALAQLVLDVGGGDHRDLALGFGAIRDAVEEPASPSSPELPVAVAGLGALASPGLGRDNSHHSKPSVAWKHVDPTQPTFFQDPGGFSSFSRAADPGPLYITLV